MARPITRGIWPIVRKQRKWIKYVGYVKSNSIFGGGHYEVVFNGEGQQRLTLTEEQGKKVIKALNDLEVYS
jgi:hypothetical protein